MKRTTALVSGALVAVAVAAGISVAIVSTPEAARASASFGDDVGVAGPFGPQAFSAIPSYFRQVTFLRSQLGEYQYIDAHLPEGRYLVQVRAVNSPAGDTPDCAGVAFALAQSPSDRTTFRGYAVVERAGDAATVSCYESGGGGITNATATFKLYYLPVAAGS